MKQCAKCKVEKSSDFFYKSKKFSDGLLSWCKPCWSAYNYSPERKLKQNEINMKRRRAEKRDGYIRDWTLRKKYGISLEDYQRMLREQGGKCALCDRDHSLFQLSLYVDHDHFNNRVRGLLCRECNSGLGKFGDDSSLLIRAAEYLKKNRRESITLIQGEN